MSQIIGVIIVAVVLFAPLIVIVATELRREYVLPFILIAIVWIALLLLGAYLAIGSV